MSSLTEVVPNLQAQGPVIDVTLGVPSWLAAALQGTGTAIPPRLPAKALLDTGASNSVVQQGLPTTLGLNPVGIQLVNTATHQAVPCPEYALSMVFPNGETGDFTVTESSSLAVQGLDCLIGRDVLQYAILIYTGPRDQFTLCF